MIHIGDWCTLDIQGSDSDINHLTVIQAQLLATIDDITSIPVEQWTSEVDPLSC